MLMNTTKLHMFLVLSTFVKYELIQPQISRYNIKNIYNQYKKHLFKYQRNNNNNTNLPPIERNKNYLGINVRVPSKFNINI